MGMVGLGFGDREMINPRDMNKISYHHSKSRDNMILYMIIGVR